MATNGHESTAFPQHTSILQSEVVSEWPRFGGICTAYKHSSCVRYVYPCHTISRTCRLVLVRYSIYRSIAILVNVRYRYFTVSRYFDISKYRMIRRYLGDIRTIRNIVDRYFDTSSSSSSSDCCAGQRSTPHSRTLEVRPGRITRKLGLRYDCDCERDETKSLLGVLMLGCDILIANDEWLIKINGRSVRLSVCLSVCQDRHGS